MILDERLALLRAAAATRARQLGEPSPGFVLFLSASDGKTRALVAHGRGTSFDDAWAEAEADLRSRAGGAPIRWLKVDWVTSTVQTNWARVRRMMERTKRNYFRRGLALTADFSVAFLEQELNANAMLYGGNAVPHAVLNEGNFRLYARTRFGDDVAISFEPEAELHLFATEGLFLDDSGVIHAINASGPDGGRRRIDRLTPQDVHGLIERSSQFLARQVGDDGRFVYGYHPCFDRQIKTYNTLRHASTTYSMIEAWEVTRDPQLLSAIERALACLSQTLIRAATLPDGSEAAFLIDSNDEIKLGGNAVAILAFSKYAAATGSRRHLQQAEALARGIAYMQDPATGAFVHVLNAGDLSLKAAYRTIYYDGEAAFGLMRLYEQTANPRWLALVEKAFEHFIAAEHWRHHDHWLSYCVNELTRYRPGEKYFRFGIANFSDHLDFVRSRITTFPTLLELMMAAERMIERLKTMPDKTHLLDKVELAKFDQALEWRAHHMLNGHFWPELAMYFRNPKRIEGSFFIRHHAFRVRIDDVEHYLSGFVAYYAYLRRQSAGGGDRGGAEAE